MNSPDWHQADLLIVDDTPANLRMLRRLLETAGYNPRQADSGPAALRAIQQDKPDLILLDVKMPEVDGYEVCRRLKADPATADIPVIFLSGLQTTDDKLKAFDVGGVDYVTKPFEPREVLARIETHLQLERLRRRTDALTHMVAHDMRSPLSSLSAYLFLMAERADDPERVCAYAESAQQNLSRVARMVNNMLDVRRLGGGHLEPDTSSVLLREVVEESLQVIPPKARSMVEVEEEHPVRADADTELTVRVLVNLLDNAARHAPDEPLDIHIGRRGDQVCIRVRDRGPGVPSTMRSRLFDAYQQEGRGRGAAGLGLAYCRLAIEAQGGEIGVEDASPGTVFWFTLPASSTGS